MGGGSSWPLIWITDASLESDTQIAAGTAAPLELFAIFGTKLFMYLRETPSAKPVVVPIGNILGISNVVQLAKSGMPNPVRFFPASKTSPSVIQNGVSSDGMPLFITCGVHLEPSHQRN